MPILTVLNQKGGVGKTSTCHHLSGTLGASGTRVLLVDADPQASLTQGLLGPGPTRAIDPGLTIASVLAGDLPEAGAVIRPAPGVPGVDLLPGSRRAESHNVPDPHLLPWDAQTALAEFLAGVAGSYDLTLIDCPPNLHLCSWAALAASDAVLVPLQAEDYGAQGIAYVQESIARVRSGPNPRLAVAGYLLTMFAPRRTIHRVYEEMLREAYGDAVLAATVPYAADYPEAVSARKTIAQHKPRSAAAKAIRAVGDELLARLASAESKGEAA